MSARPLAPLILLMMLVLQSWSSVALLDDTSSKAETIIQVSDFNQTGYVDSDIFYTQDGEAHVSRPSISWIWPNQALVMARTGACSVAVEDRGEIWLIGGRSDPNPLQSNDETPTSMVEVLNVENKTWQPSGVAMPYAQQYCEAEIIDDLIFVVADWMRNSNPTEYPSGRMQIYDLNNDTWFNGTSMPIGRGNGGMAAYDGNLYYAGGVRNPSGTDSTNQTWRYDTVNESWARMADMHHERSSFPLIEYHDELYAIGGTDSTSTWNRQALDYVEKYDPKTDTWHNLTQLPQAMFGWGATVFRDEIILVGGFNGGPKKTVYHWHPIEDRWNSGTDISGIGHFDTEVETLNGSIVWMTGDTSTYPYSTWSQTFSGDTQYQNNSDSFSGWITSPVIDLRPNQFSAATPISLNLTGVERPGGTLGFQFRTDSDSNQISNLDWAGDDGTINTTWGLGEAELNLSTPSNHLQYRIEMNVSDMAEWDEPDLDVMTVEAEHAGYDGNLMSTINPRGAGLVITTQHHLSESGEMYIQFASCDSSGSVNGPWSTISFDGTSYSESDTQGLFLGAVGGNIVNQTLGNTKITWNLYFGDLIGISNICSRAGTSGAAITVFNHPDVMEINREVHVEIIDLNPVNSSGAIAGGVDIDVVLNHTFLTTGYELSSGEVQSRLTFTYQGIVAGDDSNIQWLNETTAWIPLTNGIENTISHPLPTDISGRVDISLEARSDQPFTIIENSNSSWITLDNDAPVLIESIPANGSYVNTEEDREISLLFADTSGFISEDIVIEMWVQGLTDGIDGSVPDGLAQSAEFILVNHTMENNGTLWWLNLTQSDVANADHDFVKLRIVGEDLVGEAITLGEIFWETRAPRNGVVESISDEGADRLWEVERSISWTIEMSDDNAISDITEIRIELGGDDEFGVRFTTNDGSCFVLDDRLDAARISCTHSIVGDIMSLEVELIAGWLIDSSLLEIGVVEVVIDDIDGRTRTSFTEMWRFSNEFTVTVESLEDISGVVIGPIVPESLVRTGDELRLTGIMQHTTSNQPYNGEVNLRWWGTLQGDYWSGGSTVTVIDGVLDGIIPMPSTGGQLDFDIAIMDPLETSTLALHEPPIFHVDAMAPEILDSNAEEFSRFHLSDIGIGINIVEDDGWNGDLTLTCQIISTEISWEPISISKPPSVEFQGKILFSYTFDFSASGDPSKLSPEARIDCWATGIDDSGWELVGTTDNTVDDPWLSLPLNSIGPNLSLKEVKITGDSTAGSSLRLEISVVNTGEDIWVPFDITIHTNSSEGVELVGKFTIGSMKSNAGQNKRASVTVPEGDWILEVHVDYNNTIWELDEDDNSFSKSYMVPDEISLTAYIAGGIGAIVILALAVIFKGRGTSELASASKQESQPKDMRRKGPPLGAGPKKKGPPPAIPKDKPANIPVDAPTADVSAAMAALSLDSLPGRADEYGDSVPTFAELPHGGEYEYLAEGTFYLTESDGKWKLEEDGSFTRVVE